MLTKTKPKSCKRFYGVVENPGMLRTCYRCRLAFPATTTYFTKDLSRKNGIGYICKKCKVAVDLNRIYPLNEDQGLKVKCFRCRKEFPATIRYFNRDRHRKFGVRHICKWCQSKAAIPYKPKQKIAHDKWYMRNKDEFNAQCRLRYPFIKVRKLEGSRKTNLRRAHGWAN